tara:strand:+ start:4204 stop:6036 length:1833 start_codon:yes stop_codon:yes gene_type:complete
MNIIEKIQNVFSLDNKADTPEQSFHVSNPEHENSNDAMDLEIDVKSDFMLPIDYLDEKKIKPLLTNVSTDLELTQSIEDESKDMYTHLLNPQDIFSKQIIEKWSKSFTNDIDFLQDTQSIIQNINNPIPEKEFNKLCILRIWKNTKLNEDFVDKYNYMSWDVLKFLNNDPWFLQLLFCIHMISPVVQFCLPLFFLIFPFIILKFSGIPITVSQYILTLKIIYQQTSFGQLVFNFKNIGWDKVAYILFTIGMYFFQIYTNINLCKRFYKNIMLMNEDLHDLKKYVQYNIQNIENYLAHASGRETYKKFNADLYNHLQVLYLIKKEVNPVSPFQVTFHKLTNIGSLLKTYYIIYSNTEYENTIAYTMNFDGYINSLYQLQLSIKNGILHFADFNDDSDSKTCKIKDLYYPAISHTEPIKNDLSLNKNMIISAPNKAGKTTFIKATLLNIIFSQQFGCGFYESAEISPYSHIHSYLNIPDTSGRDSLFQAESRRCKEIINVINDNAEEKHFCIFDELYSGTNPEEAVQAGKAFIKYLNTFENVDFILTTHYKKICQTFKKSKHITNCKMVVNIEKNGSFDYTYKITKGISNIKGGIQVLKDMDYPDEILSHIK